MNEKRQRIPELDGLRVLMIFIVSWFHIWQQSWLSPVIGSVNLDYLVRSGYVWVDGTVLLSSFLLFLPYAKAMRRRLPAPDTREFYYRRVRRILPGYYFIILAVLFGIALPWRLYYSPQYLVKDVATHLTFTFTFFRDTYLATPLGAASWTLAIETQAYVLFPLVARGVMKKPVLTLCLLCAVCFGFRAWCLWSLVEYDMVVNQLINFLDVYVIGILAAMVYVRLEEKREARVTAEPAEEPRKKSGKMTAQELLKKYGGQALATFTFAADLHLRGRLLRTAADAALPGPVRQYPEDSDESDDLPAGLRGLLRGAGSFCPVCAVPPAEAPGEPDHKVPGRRQHELLPDSPDRDCAPETAPFPALGQRYAQHGSGTALAEPVYAALLRAFPGAGDPGHLRRRKTRSASDRQAAGET